MKNQPFHPSNTDRYDIPELLKVEPLLSTHLISTPKGQSINFHSSDAVRLLNKAILKHYFGIADWDIPNQYLCPPIPGRAHYIYTLHELLGTKKAHILDIGCGANIIYPLLGEKLFNWSFVGTETSLESIKVAQEIVDINKLEKKIKIRHQQNFQSIFAGVIHPNEKYDACICNPPFYKSTDHADQESLRKTKNLKAPSIKRNFGGKDHELIYPGGEFQFINNMIYESEKYKNNFNWFTTLVSRSESLKNLKKILAKKDIKEVQVLDLNKGKKVARVLAWKY